MLPLRSAAARPAEGTTGEEVNRSQLRQRASDYIAAITTNNPENTSYAVESSVMTQVAV